MDDALSSVTEEFTKRLPKIELHAHLSGSITRQCLHEIWLHKKARDPNFAIEDPWVLMPPGKVNYGLDIFFDVFSKSIYNLVNDAETIIYATKSVLNDFRADGVRYLELRTTPREIRDEDGHVLISREEYVNIVLRGIQGFQQEQQEDNEADTEMSIYLILSIDRGRDTASSAEEVVNIALHHHRTTFPNKPVIVGIDLCGNPLKGDVSLFRSAFELARAHKLGTTIHFAETIYSNENDAEELETLLSFEPDRLGHVIHVPDEIKEKIASRKLGLELCMSCNVHAKMIVGGGGYVDHHFGEWWLRTECAVSLCTDDVGFFCSPVSQEYFLASKHFGLGRGDLIALCERGVGGIFGGEGEKYRLRRLLTDFSKRNV